MTIRLPEKKKGKKETKERNKRKEKKERKKERKKEKKTDLVDRHVLKNTEFYRPKLIKEKR